MMMLTVKRMKIITAEPGSKIILHIKEALSSSHTTKLNLLYIHLVQGPIGMRIRKENLSTE